MLGYANMAQRKWRAGVPRVFRFWNGTTRVRRSNKLGRGVSPRRPVAASDQTLITEGHGTDPADPEKTQIQNPYKETGRSLCSERPVFIFLSLLLNQEMKRFRASAPQVACIRSSLFPRLAFFCCGCKCPFPIATEPKVPCSKPCQCSRIDEAEVGKGFSRERISLSCSHVQSEGETLRTEWSMSPKSCDVIAFNLFVTKTSASFAFRQNEALEIP